MSHVYKLDIVVEKNGEPVSQREIATFENQSTLSDEVVMELGMQVISVNRWALKLLETGLAMLPKQHYILQKMKDADTLKDLWADMAEMNDLTVEEWFDSITDTWPAATWKTQLNQFLSKANCIDGFVDAIDEFADTRQALADILIALKDGDNLADITDIFNKIKLSKDLAYVCSMLTSIKTSLGCS